ncbi:MAG TPA: efflux RND transporter periplasmic adaptor subunit, partial [Bacteroidales bacterium]|nr:efflux RND transporter periplasmic adaptor subunit [Bacteroidales bacterium]
MKRKSIIRWGIALLVILIVILAVARKQGWIGKEDATEVTIETAARLSI